MNGTVVFHSVRDALNAGYQICGRTDEGYLARIRTARGWALARIILPR